MKNIAFVYTEYQQNILYAICLQEKIELDVIFVRNNIAIHNEIHKFAKKIVLFDDIPYSWRSIRRYYNEYRSKIFPEINPRKNYHVFSWSIEHPSVRLLLNKLKQKKIHMLEDGTGSYLNRGLFKLGMKHFLVTTFISLVVDLISIKIKPNNRTSFVGWSLYANCFPQFNIKKNLIDHKYFQNAMMGSIEESEIVTFKKGSIVFIQQPYVEMTILNEEEYITVHIEVVMKIKKYTSANQLKIIWKLHPRTNFKDEKRRIEKIKAQTGVQIEILKEGWSMEHLAYVNKENRIKYFSLGSSSLYVILALVPMSTSVFLLENETLKQKTSTQKQINKLYSEIGIELI